MEGSCSDNQRGQRNEQDVDPKVKVCGPMSSIYPPFQILNARSRRGRKVLYEFDALFGETEGIVSVSPEKN